MKSTVPVEIEHDVPEESVQLPEAPGRHEANPYLTARRLWDERYGDVLTRARNWRAMAFLVTLLAIIEAFGMISIARKAHVVPYVVAVDNLGHTLNAGPAEQAGRLDTRVVESALSDWLKRVRTVTNDAQVQQDDIDHVYAMIEQHSAAFNFLSDYFRSNNPFKRAQTITSSVEIHSVVATSDKSYEISWTETERDLHGEAQATQNYTASITITINPPHDEQTLNINPLGIFVNQIGWSKVL